MFLFFAVILTISLILLVVIIIKLNKNNVVIIDSNSSSNKTIKKNLKSNITLKSLDLPPKVMQIGPTELQGACKTVFDSYKALDYKSAHVDRLSLSEWHSWQVSLLLAFIRVEREFHIGNPRDFFPEQVLSLTRREVEEEIHRIVQKYYNNVKYDNDRDTLSKHTIWNAREVGVLFYYMVMNRIL
jgi:hypothetical protein